MEQANLVLITAASIFGATGLALLFVGTLMAMLVALGNKHYIYGALIFLCFPVAFIYGYVYRENSGYANKLLVTGLVLFALFNGLLWWELNRLGLDFIEIMSTTRPKH